jgi:hypothetical protein
MEQWLELNDWVTLLISAVALFVSYLSYRVTRKWYRLDLRKFEEELTRRRFTISLIETIREEHPSCQTGRLSERAFWFSEKSKSSFTSLLHT